MRRAGCPDLPCNVNIYRSLKQGTVWRIKFETGFGYVTGGLGRGKSVSVTSLEYILNQVLN